MNNTNVSQVLSENFTHDENSTRDDLHMPNGIPGDGKSFMYVLIVRHQQFSFLFLFLFIYFLLGVGYRDIMKKYLVLCPAKKCVQSFNMRATGKISLLLLCYSLEIKSVLVYLLISPFF